MENIKNYNNDGDDYLDLNLKLSYMVDDFSELVDEEETEQLQTEED
jgi:hypothetical protein